MGLIDTGNQATISLSGNGEFSSAAGSAKVTRIGPLQETVSRVPIPHLGTTGYTPYMPGDLIDTDELEVEYYFLGASVSIKPHFGGTLSSPLNITINFPSNGSLSGTGFVTQRRGPEMQNNQPQTGMMSVSFDGANGPTYSG